MNIRNLLLCAVLLSCSACAGISSNVLPPPPKPISCDAEALAPIEPPLIEPEAATLGDTEEVDTINRARWERLVHRHRAAQDCFRALERAGFVQ